MKKQMLLTCAVVAMAAGKAQAGDYQYGGQSYSLSLDGHTFDHGRYNVRGSDILSAASDGGGGTFDKTWEYAATQTVETVFYWTGVDPALDPAPLATVTRSPFGTGHLQTGATGNASANAKVVFSHTPANEPTKEYSASYDAVPNTTMSPLTVYAGSLATTKTFAPELVGTKYYITVVSQYKVVSSIHAKATWDTQPAGQAPSAGANSGDGNFGGNTINYTVSCVKQ